MIALTTLKTVSKYIGNLHLSACPLASTRCRPLPIPIVPATATFTMNSEGSVKLQDVEGISLVEVVKKLEEIAPLKLAESWDNVGVLIEPERDLCVKNIMLTIDVDENSLKTAKENNAQLIIAYHPLIFKGIKSLTQSVSKDRVIMNLIQSKIAVFSPHTSWDAMENGVNDWLISHLNPKESHPILPNAENPFIGMGRIAMLSQPLTINEIIGKTRTHCDKIDPRVGFARNCDLNTKISTVAVCAGSGASVLKGVKADLYLTGEMSHHEVLDATQNNINVFLINHSNSERGFLKHFVDNFKVSDKVNLFVEEGAQDPLSPIYLL